MNKIKSCALVVKVLSLFLIGSIIIFTMINWFFPFSSLNKMINTNLNSLVLLDYQNFSFFQKLSGFLVDSISAGLIVYGLILAIQLINYIQRDQYFTPKTISLLKQITKISLLYALYVPLNGALISIITSLHKGPGNRIVTLTLGSSDIINIIFSLFIFFLMTIFQKGYELKHEQEHTI